MIPQWRLCPRKSSHRRPPRRMGFPHRVATQAFAPQAIGPLEYFKSHVGSGNLWWYMCILYCWRNPRRNVAVRPDSPQSRLPEVLAASPSFLRTYGFGCCKRLILPSGRVTMRSGAATTSALFSHPAVHASSSLMSSVSVQSMDVTCLVVFFPAP